MPRPDQLLRPWTLLLEPKPFPSEVVLYHISTMWYKGKLVPPPHGFKNLTQSGCQKSKFTPYGIYVINQMFKHVYMKAVSSICST